MCPASYRIHRLGVVLPLGPVAAGFPMCLFIDVWCFVNSVWHVRHGLYIRTVELFSMTGTTLRVFCRTRVFTPKNGFEIIGASTRLALTFLKGNV